jgi:hypothetical protein
VFTWISSPGEKVSASNIRSFTSPLRSPTLNSIQAMTNPAAHSVIAGHCRRGFVWVATLTRNGVPLAPPLVARGRAFMAVAVESDHAAMNCMPRKLVSAGAPADALIKMSSIDASRPEAASGLPPFLSSPERDDLSSNRHPALGFCWSMIFSENRCPLFGIML